MCVVLCVVCVVSFIYACLLGIASRGLGGHQTEKFELETAVTGRNLFKDPGLARWLKRIDYK